MKVDTGTVYGKRYYTVNPGLHEAWQEMIKWCVQTYGPVNGSIWADKIPTGVPYPGGRWYMNNQKFWFREEKDLTLFILKWM